jgi:hypothetical protein
MSGVPWRIITGSGLDYWIYLHFYYNDSKLQVTAHNWRLPKTRSIPSWTTSVFSSIMTDGVLMRESATFSASVDPLVNPPQLSTPYECGLLYHCFLKYKSYVWLPNCSTPGLVWPPFVALGEPDRNRRLKGFHYCCACMRCVGNMCNSAATVC